LQWSDYEIGLFAKTWLFFGPYIQKDEKVWTQFSSLFKEQKIVVFSC
jgi:hypothetical protein